MLPYRRTICILLMTVALTSQALADDSESAPAVVESSNTTNGLTASGLFVLELPDPEAELFSSLFNGPPAEYTSRLYVHESVKNFTITAVSTKPDIATIQGAVQLVPCSEANLSKDDKLTVELSENSGRPVEDAGYDVIVVNKTTLDTNMTCYDLSVNVSGVYLGYTILEFTAHYTSDEHTDTEWDTELFNRLTTRCIRFMRPIDIVFQILIYVLVCFATLGMGNDMDLQVIKSHLKTPKAPLIALASQYTFMPLLSYAVIHIMGYKGGWALGMFLMGCSPGGGSSNMYSKLLNGDMSLSITMTTISTFASLAFLPFWIYTLGRTIPADDEVGRVKIPFTSILTSLAVLIVPILIGLLIKYKLPRVSKFIKRGLKVFFIILILFFFTIGIYSNLYIYQAFRADIVFSGALLPYGGYIFGALVAWACRLEWKIIKTISLETGMQNVGLAIIVIKSALPYPDSDLAIIPPIAAVLMTSIPFYIITPIYLIRERILRRRAEKEKMVCEENGDTKMNDMDEGSDITDDSPPEYTDNEAIDKKEDKNGTSVEGEKLLNHDEEKDLP